MAHTYALGQARTTSTGNPTTVSYTVNRGDTVLGLLIKGVGGTARADGAPTLGPYTFTQANSTQIAATSPEASAEAWWIVNPHPGTYTLTIPNTGAISLRYTVAVGRAASGGHSIFAGANGSNGTSTNPTPGALTPNGDGAIYFAIVASGATTWSPSAQGGTIIANTDDGANGGGEQYLLQGARAAATLNWTFGTSDDWGAVVMAFDEVAPHNIENFKRVGIGNWGA